MSERLPESLSETSGISTMLRDLGIKIEDRQVLLGHAASSVTKVYTHPNFELAKEFVNKIPHDFDSNTN